MGGRVTLSCLDVQKRLLILGKVFERQTKQTSEMGKRAHRTQEELETGMGAVLGHRSVMNDNETS